MKQPRLQQLLTFLEEDPDDPFTLYAIAIEYSKTDDAQASKYFDQLLQDHPSYVPTYYHAAQLCLKLDQPQKAVKIFEQGIEQAQRQQDVLALRELRNAYDQYLFEADD